MFKWLFSDNSAKRELNHLRNSVFRTFDEYDELKHELEYLQCKIRAGKAENDPERIAQLKEAIKKKGYEYDLAVMEEGRHPNYTPFIGS